MKYFIDLFIKQMFDIIDIIFSFGKSVKDLTILLLVNIV